MSAALADGLDAATDGGVVIVVGGYPEPGPLNALDGDDWDRIVEATMWDTLTTLQHAYQSLRQEGARIVLVVPTIGQSGAAQLVAYTTAVEGIRSMAKSAARQWRSEGIFVNLVAAPLALFTSAVQDDVSLLRSVVESVRFLLIPHLDHLVGETIIVDGGSVMLP